jgi:hypothetical protein
LPYKFGGAYYRLRTFFVQSVADILVDLQVQKGQRAPIRRKASNELTCRQLQLIEAGTTIHDRQPLPSDLTFLASQLVRLTLPHSDPGDIPAWIRTDGNIVLVITRNKVDLKTGKLVGYPYGSIPRLLLYWLTSEALRTKSPVLRLGSSLSEFMHAVGLSLYTGGGKRSNAIRLKNQMNRLFSANIGLQSTDTTAGVDDSGGMRITTRACFWWTPKDTIQGDLFDTGWLELSHEFYQTIINSPVPVDIRALKALNHSPLALDLYAWATYKAYSTSLKNKSQFFSYKDLQQQLGAQYSELKAFGRKFRSALALVRTVYPGLEVRIETGGICIHPSQPAIPRRLIG